MKKYIIIGAGIIGCSIAREILKQKKGEVLLLEKENCLGKHASGRNSGVIHSGINQKPGSVKAKMCIEGNRLLIKYCKENNVPINECGTIVIARNKNEMAIINKLLDMGNVCGVEGLEIIDQNQLKELEPLAKGEKALFSPKGAVVDALILLETIAQEIKNLGGKIIYQEEVVGVDKLNIITKKGTYKADYIINCAGLNSDKVAQMMDLGKEYIIIPFRGEYLEVEGKDVRGMIYQPPDLRFPFLSVHLTRETNNKILAGPTAVLSFGREAYDKEFKAKEVLEMFLNISFYKMVLKPSMLKMSSAALKMSLIKTVFIKEIEKIVGSIDVGLIKPYRSGIRAQMINKNGDLVDDILVEFKDRSLHVLNCVSPGMTCSLAFAKYLVERIENSNG